MKPLSRNARLLKELKELFALIVPIFIAQLAYISMAFVDAIMAGHFSKQDLAAIALGNSIWVPVFLFMTGVILATTPKVAHLYGERNLHKIGPLIRQSFWLALFVCFVTTIVLCNARPLLIMMKTSPGTAAITMHFIYGLALGMPAIGFYQVLRCLNDGVSRPRPSMVICIIGLLINIPINYIFVFGKLGLPAMGGAGCGLASALVMWFMFLSFLWWVRVSPSYKKYNIFDRFDWPDWLTLKSLLLVGVPIGVAIFIESSIFSVIALMIAHLGDDVVAGHTITLNLSSLVFVLPYSIALAITVRVGIGLGAKDPIAARYSAHVGISLALILACCTTLLMLLFRDYLAALYTNDQTVMQLGSYLLIFSALYQLPDALQVTVAGALRGYQDTRIIMFITLMAYWAIAMPVGYSLGLSHYWGEPQGPKGFWISLSIGLSFASIFLGARFIYRSNKQVKYPKLKLG